MIIDYALRGTRAQFIKNTKVYNGFSTPNEPTSSCSILGVFPLLKTAVDSLLRTKKELKNNLSYTSPSNFLGESQQQVSDRTATII